MQSGNEKYILQSVKTALTIIDQFIDQEELSAADLSRLLDMNRSKAFRFLVTLENCGYLTRTDSNKYRLSAKVSTLGQIAQNRQELITLTHPHIANISEVTGESTHVSQMKDPIHSTFIDKCVGTRWLTMDVAIGYTQFAHASAGGKAILAHETEQFINQYIKAVTFQKYTEHSIGDAQELLKELDEIRKNGYASDKEQIDLGLTCYSVPIIVSGSPLIAISISGPTTRMIINKENSIKMLQQAKIKIEEALA